MLSLKTHLLYDTLDIVFRRCYDNTVDVFFPPIWDFTRPEALCRLIVSSNMGYRIAAYVMKRYVTHVARENNYLLFYCTQGDKRIVIMKLNAEMHVNALMKLAGMCCSEIIYWDSFHNSDWIQAFLKGLSLNGSIQPIDLQGKPLLFRAYCYKRKHISNVVYDMSEKGVHFRDSLRHARGSRINSLTFFNVVLPLTKASLEPLSNLKVHTIKVHAGNRMLNQDFFFYQRSLLRYLECFQCYVKVSIHHLLLMLERHEIDNILFSQVSLPRCRESFDEKLHALRTHVNSLWHAIERYRGNSVFIKCEYHDRIKNISHSRVIELINLILPDYQINVTGALNLSYERCSDSKKLVVNLLFHYF